MRTADFLSLVFDACDDGFVTLFCKAENKSYRFDVAGGLGKAGSLIERRKADSAWYFNVATQRVELPAHTRGRKTDVYKLPMLWADIDLAGKPGAKKNYPTREHALAAIDDLPLKPSIVVASGGGLYPLWLLKEPFVVETPEDVQKFEQRYSRPWLALIKQKLQKYGRYDLDPVGDVTRMLRVVGSLHHSGARVDAVAKVDLKGHL